ncbi:MAG: nitroreductase family protein [Caldisericia bacterium]|nr:nitroreductase family protein [Caldisericia bacterium]
MNSQNSVEDVIKSRFSCRKYESKRIDPTTKKELDTYLNTEETEHFDFSIAYSSRYQHDYIIACIDPASTNSLQFGKHFERVVLTCTQMGLATCWTGIFPQHHFRVLASSTRHASVGMITPIGYAASMPPKKQKKPWNELFFSESSYTPLDPSSCTMYKECLEMVRLAPSGMNLQPWRVVYQKGHFHFFLQRTKGIIGFAFQSLLLDLQKVDMGIALCHFELTARERDLPGEWTMSPPTLSYKEWEYIQTWQYDYTLL